MDWYYVANGQQAGPVDEAQLAELARTGTVLFDTLVWREGFSNWQPYGEVHAAATGPSASPRSSNARAAPGWLKGVLVCPKCSAALTENLLHRPELLTPCPGCDTLLQVDVFPALFRPATPGRAGEALLIEGEASCFYHADKKAVVPCEGCGRFLCGLCDCELNGRHYCPACLETGKKKGRIKNLENERTLYDSIALALAIYPMLFFYITIVTAPIALYIALRRWNAPRSIIHRTKLRLVLALVLASIQIAAWGVGAYFVITRNHA